MSRALAARFERETLAPATEQMAAVLSCELGRNRPGSRIIDIERVPCVYGSSWWLEDITLHLNDGSTLPLVFKDLGREVKGSGARRVKPAFVTEPARETWVYRMALGNAPPAPPKLWAAPTDFTTRRHWLFLERVRGVPLAQVGDRDAWCSAAHWLGHFHAVASMPHDIHDPLLRHDQDYQRGWLARALSAAEEAARSTSDVAREKLARLRALAPVHERAVQIALANPPSLIHGEFYASNVLVEQSSTTYVVHPVDWEMAALGPPLLDLAALSSGWGTDDRNAMTRAYRDGARTAGWPRCPDVDELLQGVAACRLLLAVQWLGWAAGWTAPADHRNDWLKEAERCAEELNR